MNRDGAEGRGEPDAFAVLTIDLDALGANWRALASLASPAACAAVVKADAYGLGIEHVVPALARTGCRTFFVAHVREARRTRLALRAAEVDAGQRIFVLNGYHPELAPLEDWAAFGLGPVIGSGDELAAWESVSAAAVPDAFCALHVDTGMNRLGFPVEEARLLPQARLEAAHVALVMSHFVSAESPADPLNAGQIAAFDHARERALRHYPSSLANSSGIFLPQRPVHDLVRPGYALYGGNPTPGAPNPMRSVASLHAAVLQVRNVPAGATAGYNARWTAARASRLATIGVGYADGFPFAASGRGPGAAVFVGEHAFPFVGRVSMDLCIVDITDAQTRLERGATVELLGAHVGVDDLAAAAGTIGYTVLTGLGARYRRRYVGTGTGD